MFSPGGAHASPYITFTVLNRFISREKKFGYVSLRGNVHELVVCGLDRLEKRLDWGLCKHPKT